MTILVLFRYFVVSQCSYWWYYYQLAAFILSLLDTVLDFFLILILNFFLFRWSNCMVYLYLNNRYWKNKIILLVSCINYWKIFYKSLFIFKIFYIHCLQKKLTFYFGTLRNNSVVHLLVGRSPFVIVLTFLLLLLFVNLFLDITTRFIFIFLFLNDPLIVNLSLRKSRNNWTD